MIRVLLAEDHALVRAGLVELIDAVADMTVVGAAADGEQAIVLAADADADVVLMDLSMPGIGGIEATRRIRDVAPDARVVILTSFGDREGIVNAMEAGALGYTLKDVEPDELFRAIRAAASGLTPLTPSVMQTLFSQPAETSDHDEVPGDPGRQPADLTMRELEVLDLVARGLPNQLVATRLSISEKTVKSHLTRIFRVIGVRDRTEASLWAAQHGLAPGGPGPRALVPSPAALRKSAGPQS